jgi:hypothetical protein
MCPVQTVTYVSGRSSMSRVAHSRSHIDLQHNFFALFNAQYLSRLVNQRLLLLGGKCTSKAAHRRIVAEP